MSCVVLFPINKAFCSPWFIKQDSIIVDEGIFAVKIFAMRSYCSENKLMERNYNYYTQICSYDTYILWEIKDSNLLIKKIIDIKENKDVNLQELFGNKYVDDHVKVNWFSGHAHIFNQPSINKQELETFLTIINGRIIESKVCDKDNFIEPKGFKRISNWNFHFIIPDNFYRDSLTKNFNFYVLEDDKLNTLPLFIGSTDSASFIGCYSQFNDSILLKPDREPIIINRLNRFKDMYHNFEFHKDIIIERKYGTIAYSDGLSGKTRIKIVTMANYNMNLILIFFGKGVSKKQYDKFSNILLDNIFLAESIY